MKKVISSIRIQMILTFLIFTIMTVGTITVIYTHYMNKMMKREIITQTVETANQISMQAEILLDETTKLLKWGSSTDAYNFLNAEDSRYKETVQLINDMTLYRSSSLIDSSVRNVYLFDIDGTTFNEKIGIYNRSKYDKSEYIYQQVMAEPNRLIFVPVNELEEKGMIIFGTSVLQPATNKIIGYVAVEFKNQSLEKFVKEKKIGDTGTYFIVDRGKVLLGESTIYDDIKDTINVNKTESGYFELFYKKRQLLFFFSSIPNTTAKICGCVYFEELTRDLRNIMMNIIILSGMLLLMFGILYFVGATRLTWPIWRLKGKMLEATSGNLNAYVEEYSNNEFGILEQQYDKMLKEIQELMKKNVEDQKNLQMAELKALQSQIAPHFLYNTLDTIMWLVAVNDNEKAIEMLENLSVFFKTGLSKGMDMITVERELEHVKSYLYIQQSRYSDILSYDIKVDSEILKYQILKMTLQPIVENAIYHGIKNKVNGGVITIRGQIEQNKLVFWIEDTGVGMEKREVEKLNQLMKENKISFEDHENGFGLYNVNRRIRLYFGDGNGIKIESHVEEGTKIQICIPLLERGEIKGV